MSKLVIFIFIYFVSNPAVFSQDDRPQGCLDSLKINEKCFPNGEDVDWGFWIAFPCAPEKFEIHIFDRWGNIVYASKDIHFRWDGRNPAGLNVEAGVYVYNVKFVYLGEEQEMMGYVELVR